MKVPTYFVYYELRISLWYRWEGRMVKSLEVHHDVLKSSIFKYARNRRNIWLKHHVYDRVSFKVVKRKYKEWKI